jgi:hypothetical protein
MANGFFDSPEVKGAVTEGLFGLGGGVLSGIGGGISKGKDRAESRRQFDIQSGLQREGLGLDRERLGLEKQSSFRKFQEEDRRRRLMSNIKGASRGYARNALSKTLASRGGFNG